MRTLQRALAAAGAENSGLRDALAALRAACLPSEAEELMAGQQEGAGAGAGQQADAAGPSGSKGSASEAAAAAGGEAAVDAAAAALAALAVDKAYFDSYSGFDIHRDMLSDKVRGLQGAQGHVAGGRECKGGGG